MPKVKEETHKEDNQQEGEQLLKMILKHEQLKRRIA